LQAPELSPDGQRLAVDRTVQTNRDVWLMDLVRGGWTRFTFDPAPDGFPIWSPDGTQLAYASYRKGPSDIYIKVANQTTLEQPLLESSNTKYPRDWSKDGRYLLYEESEPNRGLNLMALPLIGEDRKPIIISNTPYVEVAGQFSPDGKWVAYQ